MQHIVKRHGKKEEFDEKKVYASVYFAARTHHLNEAKSEEIAQKIVEEVKKWIDDDPEIDSQELFEFIGHKLKEIDEDVSYLYSTHRDIS